MTKLNYNRPNGGYESEPWRKTYDLPKKRKVKTTSKTKIILKETHFISGKYQGKHIGKVIKENSNYILWVLNNQPRSITAQQIMVYFNKNVPAT